MPASPPEDITSNLAWAGGVWKQLTRLQCAGVLHIALRYGERATDSNAYIDSMSNLAWPDLGRPLQEDVTRALVQLSSALSR